MALFSIVLAQNPKVLHVQNFNIVSLTHLMFYHQFWHTGHIHIRFEIFSNYFKPGFERNVNGAQRVCILFKFGG